MIKIIAITGTKGKTTVTRAISAVINCLGDNTLRMDTDGHYKNEIKKIRHGGFKSLLQKALASKVKIKFFKQEPSLVQLEYNGRIVFCRKGVIPVEKRLGDFTRNKKFTKVALQTIGIKVPKGIVANSFKEAYRMLKKQKLAYPLIVKPVDGSFARGVTWNINSEKELKNAVRIFQDKQRIYKFSAFMVEEMHIGDEFRILVFKERVISCVKKIPATIIGDGASSIKELIKEFDKKRIRGFEIKLDKIVRKNLAKHKLTLNSILPKSFAFKLRNNLNMSDGGRAIDFTSKMSPFIKKECERAMKSMGLTYGGIDLITKDISLNKPNYVILEINPNPYYNMNEKPLIEGRGVDVSFMILKNLFPGIKKLKSI